MTAERAAIPEPTRRLSPRAVWVWRGEQVLGWAVAAAIGVGLAAGPLDGALGTLAVALPLAGLVLGTAIVPGLRWSRWRWEVRPDAIDIRHGTAVVSRTLIPMSRVQHVDTTRDPVEQSLNLASVRVHTAAGAHRIPLLPVADASEVRDRIAELARTSDEP